MMQYGHLQVQDLLFASNRRGDSLRISYINGGTAGSEVVTVAGNHIYVKIEDGVSTATQIKAAVDAHPVASDLVSVAVNGTASDPQVTVLGGEIDGGTTAAFASVVFDKMKYQARTAGGNGNGMQVRQRKGTNNNSLAVTMSGQTYLDVTIALSGSTCNDIHTAVNSVAAASGLFITMADNVSMGYYTTFSNDSFFHLSGGVDAGAPSGIFQDVMVLGHNNGTTLNGSTLTYEIGGTAGSEDVTVGSGQIDIIIANGVSTAQQIVNALNSDSEFYPYYSGLIRSGGSSSAAQYTVNDIPLSGQYADPNRVGLYQETDANALLSQTYVYRPFGFAATRLYIDNLGSTGDVMVSLNGSTDHVICEAQNSTVTHLEYKPGVYLKYRTANPNFNLRASAT